jgi:hypothetical protein
VAVLQKILIDESVQARGNKEEPDAESSKTSTKEHGMI